jgi:DNA-binding transcriptional LysR family regulator
MKSVIPARSHGAAPEMIDSYCTVAFDFDLTDIQLFIDVSEANSLTHGADRSHLSVPAASTRIKNIEDRMGIPLLYRTSQGVTVTPPGQAFLHHARLVLRQIEQLRGDLQEYVRGIKGHVRILANTTSIEFLPSALSKFLSLHPGVSVDLQEMLSSDIVRAISTGIGDVGLVADGSRTENLETFRYRQNRLVVATPIGHPLAELATVPFEQTLEFDCVSLADASGHHTFLSRAAADLHKTIRLRVQVSNFEALCRLIAAGVGIGVLPEEIARRHSKAVKIRIVELSDTWARRNLVACVREFQSLPLFTKDLINVLVEEGNIPREDSPGLG